MASMQVLSCHIIKHRDTQKPRGCFVEFETRDDLVKALKKDGTVSWQSYLYDDSSLPLQHLYCLWALQFCHASAHTAQSCKQMNIHRY